MEIIGVHHVGKVVKDLNAEAELLKTIGFEVSDVKIDGAQKVRIRIAEKGEMCIELLEPLDGGSPIIRTQPGLHHICMRVRNVDEYADYIKEKGIGFPLTKPTKSVFDSRRVMFFGTKDRDVYEVIEG